MLSIYNKSICLVFATIALRILLSQAIWPFDKPAEATCRSAEEEGLTCGQHVPLVHQRHLNRSGFAEAPFLVRLQFRNGTGCIIANCSGTLLDRDLVLTSYKCSELLKNTTLTLKVGSFNAMKGREVEFRRMSRFEISKEVAECGHNDPIIHGLNLIYLSERFNFTLKKNREDIYANGICKPRLRIFPSLNELYRVYRNETFDLFNWFQHDNCAKRIRVKVTYCDGAGQHDKGRPLEKLLCFQDVDGAYNQDHFEEGAPIVKNIDGKWNLIGIVTKEADLFKRCELSHHDKARFIPIQLKDCTDNFDLP